MTDRDIYKACYETLKEAWDAWMGSTGQDAEDLAYMSGVIDMTTQMLKEYNDEDSNCRFDDERPVED